MNSTDLKSISEAAAPLIEQRIDLKEAFAALRDTCRDKGIDWTALKSLLTAKAEDARDGGERVTKILEKAEFASAYADMLGLDANMNKHNSVVREPFTVRQSPVAVISGITNEMPDIPAILRRTA